MYLDLLREQFLEIKDHGAFYSMADQGIIKEFGYMHNGKEHVDKEMFTCDKQEEWYDTLHTVSFLVANTGRGNSQ